MRSAPTVVTGNVRKIAEDAERWGPALELGEIDVAREPDEALVPALTFLRKERHERCPSAPRFIARVDA